MPPTIVFRGSRPALVRALAAIPTVLAGKAPDTVGAGRGLQLRLSQSLLSQVQQDFIVKSRGGVGRDGVKWSPLSPKTVARRTRTKGEVAAFKKAKASGKKVTALEFYGSRTVDILRSSGRLLRSITPGVDGSATGPDQLVRTTPGGVAIGSNVPYAAVHQLGTKYVPARPFLPVNGRIPDAYMGSLGLAAARGVARAIVLLLGGRS